ncbi:MAG: hypothetical protein OEY33_07795 [Bdellovibrionales bacterium]|jgi:hypothetical protein|nr:hypothetical protein [Bdellovibrionales bacterium]
MKEEYPRDYFIKLQGEDNRVGRITVNLVDDQSFTLEVDIVFKESKKIWDHVGQLFNQTSEEEGIENAVQYLSNYFKRQNND